MNERHEPDFDQLAGGDSETGHMVRLNRFKRRACVAEARRGRLLVPVQKRALQPARNKPPPRKVSTSQPANDWTAYLPRDRPRLVLCSARICSGRPAGRSFQAPDATVGRCR